MQSRGHEDELAREGVVPRTHGRDRGRDGARGTGARVVPHRVPSSRGGASAAGDLEGRLDRVLRLPLLPARLLLFLQQLAACFLLPAQFLFPSADLRFGVGILVRQWEHGEI